MASDSGSTLKKTGVLLVNLGSPAAPTRSAVRRYLRDFLSDPRVVNLPRVLWWLILHFLVLPFRSGKSAKSYRKIWTEQGAPLIIYTGQLTEKLALNFKDSSIHVEMAMRYGQPEITKKLKLFQQQGISRLIVIPLYPQYSSTTTASVFDVVSEFYNQEKFIPEFHFINDYHQNRLYIKSLADRIKAEWSQREKADLLLLSFHGLPAKLSEWGDPYAEQCYCTAELIAEQLQLAEKDWKIVFQSRFGKAEWLQPYCVDTLCELPKTGIKRIDIICPGFSVDCLETLEEINITNKKIFLDAGGEYYHYIPALNADINHVEILKALILSNTLGQKNVQSLS